MEDSIMTVTKLRPRGKATEPDGGDPFRKGLAAAIEDAGKARQAVERQKAGIARTRASMYAAGAAVEKAQEGVGKSQRDYATALAASAAASGAPPPSSGVRKARQAVTDAEDHRDALKAALAKLEEDLPFVVADLRNAEIAVDQAISMILAEPAQQLIKRGEEIASQLGPIRQALAALWAEHSPGEHHAALAHQSGRRPLEETKEAASSFLQSTSAVERGRDLWAAARQILRENPHADLPAELTALLGP
jgi:hypothetical protein